MSSWPFTFRQGAASIKGMQPESQRDSGKPTQNGRAMNDYAPRTQIHPPIAARDEFATTISRDGTLIAYDRSGRGPAVVVVDATFGSRTFGPNVKLPARLSAHHTVFHYDRRGRGGSGDTRPYAVAREVEDLEAVIDAAGGQACVYGISSGAVLAVDAARPGRESLAPQRGRPGRVRTEPRT